MYPNNNETSQTVKTGNKALWLKGIMHHLWIGIAGILIAVLWLATEVKLLSEREATLDRGATRAMSLSAAYSEQIGRTLDEIDRITLLLRTLRLEKKDNLKLEEYSRNGIFPEAFFNASIANRNGDVVGSTFGMSDPLNFADRAWFRSHQTGPVNRLLISPQEIGPRTGRSIIRFSRRLETPAGEFDGAAWVTTEPPFLTTFYGASQLNTGEFISIRLWNGPVLATKVGQLDGKTPIFYQHNPIFSTQEGLVNEPGSKFVDGAERLVAWKKSTKYPVVAIVGFKKEEILRPYYASAAAWRSASGLVTLLLVLAAAAGIWFSRKLNDRKRQAEETKETYRLAVDAAQEGFYMLRPISDKTGYALDFRIEDCNERAAAFAGVQRTKILGHALSKILPVEYQHDTLRILRNVMKTGFLEEEFRVPAPKGTQPAWLYRRFMRSASGIAMVVRDISSSKAHQQELVLLANTDALTGLSNRHWLVNYLPIALARAGNSMKQLAVLFIDLDDFKNINDTLGHDAGDELLKEVAFRLTQAIRASDRAVRLGGDEFTIVLEQLDGANDVCRVAGQILQSLSAPFVLKGNFSQHIHASIGISSYPKDGRDGETLLKHADVAMYAAKSAGKGRYYFYHPDLSESLIGGLSREHAVRRAVENDEFLERLTK